MDPRQIKIGRKKLTVGRDERGKRVAGINATTRSVPSKNP